MTPLSDDEDSNPLVARSVGVEMLVGWKGREKKVEVRGFISQG